MKKATLILAAAFFSVTLFGQTTEEEYNYLTKGYKVQIESGLDMKKGYEFKDLANDYTQFYKTISGGLFESDQTTLETRGVKFLALHKIGDVKPKALLMIYTGPDNSISYFCIPTSNSEATIKEKAFDTLVKSFWGSPGALLTIIKCLTTLSGKLGGF